MRHLAAITLSTICILLASCGGQDEGSDGTAKVTSRSAHQDSASITDGPEPSHVRLAPGPPPTHLIVKDIRRGTGPAIPAKRRVGIHTNYVAVSYRTGKPIEVRWRRVGGFNIEFGPGLVNKGWEKGLIGMRVGGRRELRVPSRLAYKEGAIFYVIDLLAVER